MKINFKYDKKDSYVSVIPQEEKYKSLDHMGNKWELTDVHNIISEMQQAQLDKTVEDFTIDGLTGYLWIFPDIQSASVYEHFPDSDNKSLLHLTFSEVIEFFTLMEEFLKNLK